MSSHAVSGNRMLTGEAVMSTDKVVVCMKWGTLFPSSHVNMLYNAVRANVSGPLRFVCFTDNPAGLSHYVEAYPITDHGFPPERWKKGAWIKLSLYSRTLAGLTGRALFIDLDMMVLGSLDPFFDYGKGYCAVGGGRNWRRGSENLTPSLNSCMFAFDVGAEPQILDRYLVDPRTCYEHYRLEQRFVQDNVSGWTPWPADWVISFKRHLVKPKGLGLLLPPDDPPASAKVLAFHGDPRPIDLTRHDWWGKFPHMGRGPVPFVLDYFNRFGVEA